MLFIGDLDFFLIVLIIVTITMLTSELMSNTAVAALLLPIMAVPVGSATELDPILFMAPVAFATSYGLSCLWELSKCNSLEVVMCIH